MKHDEFVIRRAGYSSNGLCPATNQTLPATVRFAIYNRANRQFSREGAASVASKDLVSLLDYIESNVGDVAGDDISIGVAELQPHSSEPCILAYSRFQRLNMPVARRGKFDLSVGVAQGCQLTRINLDVADRICPALSAVMHKFFGTKPGERIETPAEQEARETIERAKQSDANRVARELELQDEREQRRKSAVDDVAAVLTEGKVTAADRRRAEALLDVLSRHYGLTAK